MGPYIVGKSQMKHPLVLVTVLFATLLVRVGVLVAWPGALVDDPDGYRELAENLWRHGTFGYAPDQPTAYRPPLYPLLLVPCVALGGWSRVAIAAIHVLLGLGTVALTFLIAERWTTFVCKPTDGVGGKSAFIPKPTDGVGGKSAGQAPPLNDLLRGLPAAAIAVMASLLVAVDPILLVQSTQVMTETTAVFLAMLVLWLFTCDEPHLAAGLAPRFFVAGITLGLAALCRPVFLAWAVLLVLAALWRRRWVLAITLIVGVGVTLAPWTARNWNVFGRPLVATTHGGYTFLLGNNPWFYDYLDEGHWTAWEADGFHRWWKNAGQAPPLNDEVERDRRAYRYAFRFIAEQPGMFAYSCLVRVGRLWSPLPLRDSPWRWAVAVWYAIELALALIGACVICVGNSRKRQPAEAAVLLVLSLTAVHAFYWSNLRMRAPLMPVIAIAAVVGLAWLVGRKWFR